MSSSTFEVKEPENEKVLEFGLDACEENGLEVSSNVDGEVPKDHTYTKEPDVEEKDEVKDSEDNQSDTMESASPKKKPGRQPKNKKAAKINSPKGKAKKETPKKEPVPKKGKKKEIANEEEIVVVDEVTDNGELDKKAKTVASVEEPPKTSKRGKKRKVEEKENVIDQSIMEEVQNINEDQSAADEKGTETPAKKKKVANDEKTSKAKKSSKTVSNSDGVIEDTANLPKGWVKKSVTRKSGKSAGMVDIYIYSPEGIKFRSKPDVAAYLARTKSSLKIDDFDFSKRKAGSADSPSTPAKAKSSPAKSKASEKKKPASPKKKAKIVVKLTPSKKKNEKITKDTVATPKKSKTTKKSKSTGKVKTPKGNKKK